MTLYLHYEILWRILINGGVKMGRFASNFGGVKPAKTQTPNVPVRMYLCECTCANVPVRMYLCECTCANVPVRMYLCECTCPKTFRPKRGSEDRNRSSGLSRLPSLPSGQLRRAQSLLVNRYLLLNIILIIILNAIRLDLLFIDLFRFTIKILKISLL
jgi:hypothetical protein